MASIKIKTQSTPYLKEGSYSVKEVHELNFFDLSGEKSKTKGSSNKMYHAEMHISNSDKKGQILTMYGPTGSVQAKDYRYFSEKGDSDKGIGLLSDIEKEYNKLLASKRKKGYKDIDVAQRSIGSDDAKKITKAVELKNIDLIIKPSLVNEGQKKIVDIFFGSQNHFISTTLKCPLGQLTNKQIDDGRAVLDEAKAIVNTNKKLTDDNKKKLLELTNMFYGLIPHNLGAGARGVMTELLLDDLQKIMKKEDDLDTLLDAKAVNAVISSDSNYDDKYISLNCDFELIDKKSDIFSFLSSYFMDSRVGRHGYSKISVKNIWKMHRKDEKEKKFIVNATKIAKNDCEYTFNKYISSRLKNSKDFDVDHRPDLSNHEKQLLKASNSWLCWHGTRSANLVGITRRGLLIRPSGAVHTGSMFGDGKYYAWQSTKSLNYCDGGYWTGGKSSNSKFMFALDVCFGKMFEQKTSKFFKSAPKGFHSVFAKGGADLINDEMITYDFEDDDNQASMKYLFEIE